MVYYEFISFLVVIFWLESCAIFSYTLSKVSSSGWEIKIVVNYDKCVWKIDSTMKFKYPLIELQGYNLSVLQDLTLDFRTLVLPKL